MNRSPLANLTWLPAVAALMLCTPLAAAPPQDLKDKIVLANPDKYVVGIRLGKQQRTIEPNKASVLSPKKYPVSIEIWTGKAETGWSKTEIEAAGVYDFRWQGGQWSLKRRVAKARPSAAKPTTAARPSYNRSTGSHSRVARGPSYGRRYPSRRPIRGGYWNSWVRGVWGMATLYRFIRDEEDRDLLREIIIGGEIDDEIRREIEDAIRDDLIAVPFGERREIEQAIDDISRLDSEDWKEISNLPANEWDQLRGEIGDEISDNEWQGLGDWVDTMDQPGAGNLDLDDIGVETLDENVDLGDLGGLDENVDLDFGQGIEDIDLGDLAADAETMDLSDFDAGGYEGGLDLGDLDLGDLDLGNAGLGDAGGGLGDAMGGAIGGGQMGGGGWGGGGGGFDMNYGGYDAGGFDNMGGGWGGGFGGGDFGGGFGGDFGGGFGGDFGGGDFGGFDDFGGGFDF